MDYDKKLAFLQSMTHMALSHAQRIPNIATPSGGMTHDKMLEFVRKVAEKGVEHFAQGGTTTGGFGGAISSFLGTQNNYEAQQANITPGTNAGQLDTAYGRVQGGLGQQQNVANTLTPGVSQGAGTQNTLNNLYLNQVQGNGPSPAQAQLNQATGQNIAQTAALIAGARGGNAGLSAEAAARQGANTQQQAVGQSATLRAQEQLAAENNLQNLASTQVNQGQSAVQGVNNAEQNEQNILQGANTAANNANVAMTSNINTTNAAIATANQNASANAVNGAGGLLGNLPAAVTTLGGLFAEGGMVRLDKGGNVLDAKSRAHIADDNFALPNRRYPIHDMAHARNALARVAQNGTPEEKKKVKAAVHKKYPALAGKKMAKGGDVKKDLSQVESSPMVMPPVHPAYMADGGLTPQAVSSPSNSFVGNWLNSNTSSVGPTVAPSANINTNIADPFKFEDSLGKKPKEAAKTADTSALIGGDPIATTAGAGDAIGAAGAGGEAAGLGEIVGELAPLALAYKGGLMKNGGKVQAHGKAEKASREGDSLDNDKVPAMLSEGEIVIPRHITMGPNAPARAAQFVAQQLAKRGRK